MGKALFLFQQAAAIGTIVVNTAIANSKVLAEYPGPPGWIMAGIQTAAAAVSIANVVAQTVATFNPPSDSGKQSGGYADRDMSDSSPKGVYHANEFIASAPAVRNPTVKPILDIIDIAQRTGTIKNLNLANVLTGVGKQAGGYGSDKNGSSIMIGGSNSKVEALLTKLNAHLDKGLTANVNKYGHKGIDEAYAEITKFNSITK